MGSKPVWQGNLQKHTSKNPVIRSMMRTYYRDVCTAAELARTSTILDAGCGEGFTTTKVADHLPEAHILAADMQPEYIEFARENHSRKNITFKVAELNELSRSSSFNLVMCTQVLEHLPDYDAAMKLLCSLSDSHVLITVPNEPWFRIGNLLRLKYVTSLGNTPGHINHWSKNGLKKLLSRFGTIEFLKTSTVWTVGLISIQ